MPAESTGKVPFHPPLPLLPSRSHLTEAAALYNLVDDQLHVLVTASNHLLRRLELRVRLGHLEAAIQQVKGRLLGDTVLHRGHFVLELKHQAGSPWCWGQGRKHTIQSVLQGFNYEHKGCTY